jgi:hypothetical protein
MMDAVHAAKTLVENNSATDKVTLVAPKIETNQTPGSFLR